MKNKILNNSLLILIITFITILLNYSVITFNLFYFEQALMYVAHQHALNFKELLYQYTHPKFLNINIPFFRPSGHFLIYSLLTPIIGWHSNKIFLTINLIFLAFSGVLIFKIYTHLFRGWWVGGIIAFMLYMMHPALILSRLSVMHFEYIYIFLSLASLYFFIIFIENNNSLKPIKNYSFLLISLIFFVIATTFKEVALMIGPLLFCYFWVFNFNKKSLKNIEAWKLSFLLFYITVTLFLYLTSMWPTFENPYRGYVSIGSEITALKVLLKYLVGIDAHQYFIWREIITPLPAQIILGITSLLFFALFLPTIKLTSQETKSTIFLLCAVILFLIFPCLWALAYPWHLGLTLVFFCLLLGFALEFFLKKITAQYYKKLGFIIVFALALLTIQNNVANIHYYKKHYNLYFVLNRNAILHPPAIKNKLNTESILVIEDSHLHNAYGIGASAYPFLINPSPKINIATQKANLIITEPNFNGTLFKLAYLLPDLHEQEVPFSINEMQKLGNPVIHNWLQHQNNIFCFGYDRKGNWLDKTEIFKKKLMAEAIKRNLQVHSYKEYPQKFLMAKVDAHFSTAVPDSQLCRYYCDQNAHCKAVAVIQAFLPADIPMQCVLYSGVSDRLVASKVSDVYIKT